MIFALSCLMSCVIFSCCSKANMAELKRSRMDLPPAPSKEEEAKLEFGTLVKPTFAQETGLRISSNNSKKTLEQRFSCTADT